jgi:tRNA(Arg) A34 adenosine deaminase TadA
MHSFFRVGAGFFDGHQSPDAGMSLGPLEISSPSQALDGAAMAIAIGLAHRAHRMGEVPVGAVALYQGRLVARAHNLVERWQQPLAHAEALCVLQAQKRLGRKYLHDVSLYSTLQPCAACWEILVASRLQRLVFGAYDTSRPIGLAPCVVGGLCQTQCAQPLQTFFAGHRDNR